MYAHVSFGLAEVAGGKETGGTDLVPTKVSRQRKEKYAFHETIPLVRYRRFKVPKVLKNLLESDSSEAPPTPLYDPAAPPILAHWVPTLDISLVLDVPQPMTKDQIPATVYPFMKFSSEGTFYPIVYHNG